MRILLTSACLLTLAGPGVTRAQRPTAPAWPERAIRRDIPLTNAIRSALAAGTRDSSGRPGAKYWQLRTDYTIQVRLDTATSRLSGTQVIELHNTSPDSLPTIAFRLDYNHFIGTNPRLTPWVPAENTDGVVITAMKIDGRDVVLDPVGPPTSARPAQPTLVNRRSTRASLRLPSALASGATARIEIEWNARVPGGPGQNHRMTQRWGDTLYQPTQWYPRIAKYDDLRGWDRELYLGPSEFYNNFGRFDVSIDVPAGWLVSGTGTLQNGADVLTPTARERLARVTGSDSITTIVGAEESGPGRATAAGTRLVWRFTADSVNDFAWATSRSYVWRATRATIPGRGPVPIHMLHLPGRASLFANAGPITRHALEFYSGLWFPYPFPQLTLQDGPSAGMEYPMVINSNQGAADHEAGHQWWPMVVGNNETWYGWMDEGFNQYMNILSGADAAKRPADLNRLGQSYGFVSGAESEPPMMWNANYAGPEFYGFTTYSKTPLMLAMLGGIVGDSAVQRAHREFAQAWMWKHPSPWDWMFFMNRALGRDLGWFWHSWLFTTERVDGRIDTVTTRGARTVVRVSQAGQMPSPIVLKVRFATTGAPIRPMSNAVMQDSVTAVVTLPVETWFSGRKSVEIAMAFGARPIEKITLDPHCRFPDATLEDNVWPRDPAIAAAAGDQAKQVLLCPR
jgi:hypothetical protein